jgi:hypothetical protein
MDLYQNINNQILVEWKSDIAQTSLAVCLDSQFHNTMHFATSHPLCLPLSKVCASPETATNLP